MVHPITNITSIYQSKVKETLTEMETNWNDAKPIVNDRYRRRKLVARCPVRNKRNKV